ncbi:Uncharacterised protein [Mycobacteroides abscessus subsp. abscessus]|nr:Uncharacterised protein [Mycobacteroides abscessus subsp. abscessus]
MDPRLWLVARQFYRQRRLAPRGAEEGEHRTRHVASRGDLLALIAMGFHRGDHLAVQTHPRVEDEPALAAVPQGDAAPSQLLAPVLVQQVDDLIGGLCGVRGNAQCSGEHIGRTTRYHRHGGQRARRGVPRLPQQPVHHLADRAVAAVHDDDRRPLVGRATRQLAGMPPVIGV